MLKQGAERFGVSLDDKMLEAFSKYKELLLDWNTRMNLTAITDDKEITFKHFVDSLTIYNDIKGGSLIDVGTGAGFPGIPLKICKPELKVTLLDSLEKRVKFLNTVIKELGLTDIQAVHYRAEEGAHSNLYREKFDYAVARAVAGLPVLLEYCLPFVKVGGQFIAMKGSNVDEEINLSKNALKQLGGEIKQVKFIDFFEINAERNVVSVSKIRQTPTRFPRKAGKPGKEPL